MPKCVICHKKTTPKHPLPAPPPPPPPPPVIVAPPPPPPPTPPPVGVIDRGNYPPTFQWELWDCGPTEIALAAADGIATTNVTPALDFVGGEGSGQAWYDANVAAGFKMAVGPGFLYPTPEYTSNLLTLAADPNIVRLEGPDEPTDADAATLTTRFAGWKSACAGANLNCPPIGVNLPSATLYYQSEPADLLNIADVDVWSGDEYGFSKTATSGEDLGLRGVGGSGFTDAFTSTQEGYFIERMVRGPGFGNATGPLGKPCMAYVGVTRLTTAGVDPTVGETRRSIFSGVIKGGPGVRLWTTKDASTPSQTRYQWSPGIKAEVLDAKAKIAKIEAAGFLIKAGGGRIPTTPRMSAPANSAPNGAVPSPAKTGATGTATGTRLPYGFEGVELWNEAHTDYLILVQNFTDDARTLTDATWGFSSVSFAAYEVKCYTSAKANFWGTIITDPVPASVLAAGLSSVWNLRSSAGPQSGTVFKTPAANAGSLPSGTSVGTLFGFPAIWVSSTANFSAWDFRGYTVIINTMAPVTFTDCKFQAHPDSGQSAVYGGTASGFDANVTMTRCSGNGLTNRLPYPAPEPRPGGLLSMRGQFMMTGSSMVNASGDIFNWDSGPLTLDGNYLACPGLKVHFDADPDLNAHFEALNIAGGNVLLNGNLIDWLDNAAAVKAICDAFPGAGATAVLLWQARVAAIVGVASNNIILGRQVPMFYANRFYADAKGADITYTNNVLQRPTNPGGTIGTGYIDTEGAVVHRGSGNRDFDTGALIVGGVNT